MKNKDKILLEFETFKSIGSYDVSNMVLSEPSASNGMVRVKKYRVAVTEVEEPDEVIIKRIHDLWEAKSEQHQYQTLLDAAKEYGVNLDRDKFGGWNK